MTVRILQGDCRDVLRTLPDESVHCIVTSPPYFGLRDYGTAKWDGGDPACDHVVGEIRTGLGMAALGVQYRGGGHKAAEPKQMTAKSTCPHCGARRIDSQIGLETTPDEYVAELVGVFRECRRVLRRDGTLFLNLGDSYCSTDKWGGGGNGNNGKHTVADDGTIPSWAVRQHRAAMDGIKPKDLIGIPWLVAFALRADGWYLRSDIIWAKPNPMPESVTDRPTKAHEYLFLLSKNERYYYDAEAIKEPGITSYQHEAMRERNVGGRTDGYTTIKTAGGLGCDPSGRNRRSVWTVATQSFSEAHFATFPPDLIEPCIKAGTSEKGCCAKCGAPWKREVSGGKYEPPLVDDGVRAVDASRGDKTRKLDGKSKEWRDAAASRTTTGWTPSCSCEAGVVPCTVLDPFGGAGTTALVADRLQRNSIIIELNPEYAAMSRSRVEKDAGMFAVTEAA